jgi:hypothetical protein
MKTLKLLNYAQDRWDGAEHGLAPVESAVTGQIVAETGSGGLDFEAMLDHGRRVGGPALRRLTFHERAHARCRDERGRLTSRGFKATSSTQTRCSPRPPRQGDHQGKLAAVIRPIECQLVNHIPPSGPAAIPSG